MSTSVHQPEHVCFARRHWYYLSHPTIACGKEFEIKVLVENRSVSELALDSMLTSLTCPKFPRRTRHSISTIILGNGLVQSSHLVGQVQRIRMNETILEE
mmetsp:Transcript_21115/g.42270  ORF Transcript_21115/g.42270 Transcript_21115/m.42270 type:complete len:100 (+) Transcript_21115:4082-4381(+)